MTQMKRIDADKMELVHQDITDKVIEAFYNDKKKNKSV